MKKIKITVTLFLSLLFVAELSAQETKEYRFSLTGRLMVNGLNKVTFEGYEGNEVIISTQIKSTSKSERAEGLTLISGSGLEDNTGIGLSVEKTNYGARVDEISNRSSRRYLVKVPKNIIVGYEHNSVHGSTVIFNDLSNELEIETNHSGITLNGVTGPMTVSTVHGRIEGTFGSLNQNGPVSIASAHGLIDITLPAATKADLNLSTNFGEIYSNMDIAVVKKQEEMRQYGGSDIKGTINGGGTKVDLTSDHGNIYLRRK